MNILKKIYTVNFFVIPVISASVAILSTLFMQIGTIHSFLIVYIICRILRGIYQYILDRKNTLKEMPPVFVDNKECTVEEQIKKNRVFLAIGVFAVLMLTYLILMFGKELEFLRFELAMVALISVMYCTVCLNAKKITEVVLGRKLQFQYMLMAILCFALGRYLVLNFSIPLVLMLIIVFILVYILVILYNDMTRPYCIPIEG